MFQKSFVSLVFTSKKLQILKLDDKKNKVIKSGSFDLPPGLIINYQIKDINALSEIIKKAWTELKIKEKSVGLVIPEFSTYTKSLNLPVLDEEDLDEAIRWQSQVFLPTGGREMIIDWQIIEKNDNGFNLLVVAVREDILVSYVDATSKGGLFPLVVETPSLSLTRISDDNQLVNRLLIYIGGDESIIVLAKGKTIVASSVASSTSQNEIIQTAYRILHHYTSFEVKKIMVGGVNLTKDFLDSLATNLNLPVETISKKVEGLDEAKIQEYLIAISLQLKDPSFPEDEKSINLLPPSWIKHYRELLRNFQLWMLSLVGSIFIWALFLALLITYIFLIRESSVLRISTNLGMESESDSVFDEVQEVNALTKKILSTSGSRKSPEEIINLVAQTRPDGITMTHYLVNLETGKVEIAGNASDRASLIKFKQALEEQEMFSVVDLPITSLINETNLTFTMQITLARQKSS